MRSELFPPQFCVLFQKRLGAGRIVGKTVIERHQVAHFSHKLIIVVNCAPVILVRPFQVCLSVIQNYAAILNLAENITALSGTLVEHLIEYRSDCFV